MITYQGCRNLCGSGVQYYPWANSSQTIATWVLPIVSVLVQAPYESNAFLKTIFALARWVGSPMATLSYTLWNVHVTAKCATMVDMATKYGDTPPQNSAFGRIRDSFYILSVINQCTSEMRLHLTLQLWYDILNTRSLLLTGTTDSIKDRMPSIEAEKLLRVALFSDTLRLSEAPPSLS